MKKYFEHVSTVGCALLVILPFLYGGWFLSGRYKNEKIECLKKYPGEETHYNVLSGCWYWSERQQKMIKPGDYQEKLLIKQEKRPLTTEEILTKYGAELIEE